MSRTVLRYYSILTVLLRYYYSIKPLHSLAVFTNLSITVLRYYDATTLHDYAVTLSLSGGILGIQSKGITRAYQSNVPEGRGSVT